MVRPFASNPTHDGTSNQRHAYRPSIRVAMLVAINIVLLVALAILLTVDYQRGLAARMEDKRVSLNEEAALLLPAVAALRHHGHEAVQSYIDDACAQMQDTLSPGHHIAVELDGVVLQATTHQRASSALVEAMRHAAESSSAKVHMHGDPIIVGTSANDDSRIYVSEFTTNIRNAARVRLISRAGAIAFIGFSLTVIINLILLRLVSHPIQRMVETVRAVARGQLGETPPHFGTAEFDYLAREVGQMSRSLADAEHERHLQMRKARRIQQNLLPKTDELDRLGLVHVYQPAEDVGGDFLDVHEYESGRVAICLGDVTGHGVPAAMGAAMLKTMFQQIVARSEQPAEILAEVNKRFHAVSLEGDFATMFLGILDRPSGQFTYASAGHEAAYVLRTTGVVEELSSTGMLLGIDPEANCEVAQLTIHLGDTIVLLTDGLTETMSPEGKPLGRQAVIAALVTGVDNAPQPESPDGLADRLLRLAANHRDGGPQLDDITLATLRV